jgi:uncharacterized protein (TIGR02300 family)
LGKAAGGKSDAAFDSGTKLWQGARQFSRWLRRCGLAGMCILLHIDQPIVSKTEALFMIKPEWGAKHSCPKCGTRFYDLGKDDPVSCINCGNSWTPEPVLKSKQPLPFEEEKKKVIEKEDVDLADEDLDIDEDGDSPDNDVDLGGDDDLGVAAADDDDEES